MNKRGWIAFVLLLFLFCSGFVPYEGKTEKPKADGVWRAECMETAANKDSADGEKAAPELRYLGGFRPTRETRSEIRKLVSEIRESGRQVSFLMLDIDSGKGVAYNEGQQFYSASTVKGPFVASLIREDAERLDSEENTIRRILEYSDNDSYGLLFNRYGAQACKDMAKSYGYEMEFTDCWYTKYTSEELGRLWLGCYDTFAEGKEGEELGELFENPERSAIRKALGEECATRSKGGWISERGYCVTNDAGIVYADNGPYILVIMSDYPSRMDELEPIAESLHLAHKEIKAQSGKEATNEA